MGLWFDILSGFIGVILAVVLVLWVMYKILVVDFDQARIVKMRETKGVARHYYCAIMQTFYMKGGQWYPLQEDEIIKVDPNSEINRSDRYKVLEILTPHPSEKLVVIDCYMQHRQLRLYRECINFSGHHTQLPPCMLFAYFNKAVVAIGASYYARARLLGVIHTKQEITVHQDLRPLLTGRFSFRTRAEEYRKSTRGIEGDLSLKVFDEHDILVWEGRGQGVSLNDSYKPRKAPKKAITDFEVYKEEPIISHMDTGYKYAKAAIDWQPQHLSRWMARLAGFKNPVAHGMWVAAMAVESVTKNESCFQQTYPMHIEVVFRSPMQLGTKALMRYDKPKGSNSLTNMRMVDSTTERPILDGRMYVGPKMKAV